MVEQPSQILVEDGFLAVAEARDEAKRVRARVAKAENDQAEAVAELRDAETQTRILEQKILSEEKRQLDADFDPEVFERLERELSVAKKRAKRARILLERTQQPLEQARALLERVLKESFRDEARGRVRRLHKLLLDAQQASVELYDFYEEANARFGQGQKTVPPLTFPVLHGADRQSDPVRYWRNSVDAQLKGVATDS